MNELSATKVKNLKGKSKKYSISDGNNLYLRVMPTGRKVWEIIDNRGRKRSTKVLGRYPAMSLANARVSRDEYFSHDIGSRITFEELIDMYFKHREDELSAKYIKDNKQTLDRDFFDIKAKKLQDIKPTDLIKAFERMEKRDIKTASKKIGSQVNRLFKYAMTKQLLSTNPMASIDLGILLKKHSPKNFNHISDEKVFKALLCAINGYIGDNTTRNILRLMPYVFVRPSNLREMQWAHINFEKNQWTIPDTMMKTKKEHIVPLTPSMIEIIEDQKDNGSIYVFPSPQSRMRPMSDNTPNMALKRMGFAGIMTSHGFRHTASTLLNEHKQNHKLGSYVIEAQLAHSLHGIAGVYNKADYLKERHKLMKWWSDFIDKLQESCEEDQ